MDQHRSLRALSSCTIAVLFEISFCVISLGHLLVAITKCATTSLLVLSSLALKSRKHMACSQMNLMLQSSDRTRMCLECIFPRSGCECG
jgi:hypothetical protein